MSKAVINPEAIASLSDAIATLNSKINISQYAPLTIASGVSGTIYIGRLGKQRVLTGYFKPDNAGTSILIATLASGDKPPVSIYFSCTGYTVGGQCECSISTTGEIRANVPTGGNNNTVKFNASWFID